MSCFATISSKRRTYCGSCSGETAVSSTYGSGLASPLSAIASPSPASRSAYQRCCSTGSFVIMVA